MKKVFSSLLLLTAFLLFVPLSSVSAGEDKVTICHVLSTPHQTLTISESALSAHLAHGDTLGACSSPNVPEFGLIPGAVAAIASGGAFLLLKRRASKS